MIVTGICIMHELSCARLKQRC